MSEEVRNRKIFGILCLLVALVAVTFAYASLTHTLKVKAMYDDLYGNKYGTSQGKYWDIHFENLSKANITGSAEENVAPKIIYPVTIGNYMVTFHTPGDSVTYTFDVVNTGKIDAILSSVNLSTPNCVGNLYDCRNTLKNVNYKITYIDGSELKYGDNLFAKSDDVGKPYRKQMKLVVSYSKDTSVNELPDESVILENLEAILIYVSKNGE